MFLLFVIRRVNKNSMTVVVVADSRNILCGPSCTDGGSIETWTLSILDLGYRQNASSRAFGYIDVASNATTTWHKLERPFTPSDLSP